MNTQILSPGFEHPGRKHLLWTFVISLLGFMLLAFTQANAAAAIDPKARERGMKEAPALIADAKAPCELTDAIFIGAAKFKKDGKEVSGNTYEVACKDGAGLIMTRLATGQPDVAFNCVQAEAYNKVNKGISACVLPGNIPNYTWMTPIVQKVTPKCVVNRARWVGAVGDKKVTRYEIGCEQANGGIYDIPDYDNPDQSTMVYHSCVQVLGTSSKCDFVTPEEAMKTMAPLVAKGSPSCTMNNFRYIGAGQDVSYYEVGCANELGFILVTNAAGDYKSTVGCDRAESIGGCKYTDSTKLAAANDANYAKVLSKAGVTCSVSQYVLIGTINAANPAASRDLIEFACPEKPWGLMAFVPTAQSTAKLDAFDCFVVLARRIQGGRVKCSLITEETLQAQVAVMAKASAEVKKDCVLKEVRYVGLNDADDVIVEIACVNKRGYLATLNGARTTLSDALPCTIAQKYREKCTIEGNGTYMAP